MSGDFEHIDFARNNEDFAEEIVTDISNQNNWVVIVRFYSYLHYVEERLTSEGLTSDSHHDRKKNILRCKAIDNKARNIYRFLEDISRDARYECMSMSDDDVASSLAKLEEGKSVLGFSDQGGGSTKYTVS